MTYDTPPPSPFSSDSMFALLAALVCLCVALSGCAKTERLPAPAPVAQAVYIPVPIPCEVEQIESSPLATAEGVEPDIFEAVKAVLADREILLADRQRLAAANSDPCPAE